MNSFVLDIFYPKKCIFCGEVLSFGSENVLCNSCTDKVHTIGEYCERCGKEIDPKETLCSDCKHPLHFFDKGRSVFVYEDEVKNAILDMKYHEKMYLSEFFAKLLYDLFASELAWDIDVVVSVPLHKARFRKRGYNQSELLARAFASLAGIKYKNDILKKVKNTHSQQELSREERLKNMMGTFEARPNKVYSKVLIIDDVYTTGSTIDACSKALLDNGYKEVYFLTIATGRRV